MNTIKPRFLLLALLIVPLLSGCWGFTTHSYPEDKQPVSLRRFQALSQLAGGDRATEQGGQQWIYLDRAYTTTYSFNAFAGVRFPDDQQVPCRYADTPVEDIEMRTEWWPMYWFIPIPFGQHLYVRCQGDDDTVPVGWGSEENVDAWISLARHQPMSSTAFAGVVERSRGRKIELSEAVRSFKVRAESAVREKKYWEAADLLDQGLTLEPAWAQGHYNLGLICEELGLFDCAIDEMNKYLALVPKSENARAIQDKIYVWQGKLRAS